MCLHLGEVRLPETLLWTTPISESPQPLALHQLSFSCPVCLFSNSNMWIYIIQLNILLFLLFVFYRIALARHNSCTIKFTLLKYIIFPLLLAYNFNFPGSLWILILYV